MTGDAKSVEDSDEFSHQNFTDAATADAVGGCALTHVQNV